MSRPDHGSATPFVAVLLALATAAGVTITAGVRGVIEAERAAIAADAAALGGVLGGERLARVVAAGNGATLVETIDTTAHDGRFEAKVRLGAREAAAVAADSWFPTAPTLRR